MIRELAIVVVAFSWLGAGAQSRAAPWLQVTGTVTDTAGMALPKATVRLFEERDTTTVLSKEDGSFTFWRVQTKPFHLLITMKGYKPSNALYIPSNGLNPLHLQPISLQTVYSELDPVTVSKVRPVSILGDTVSYSATAFLVRDGSEVEDMLKRLPGVEVDINGNVMVQGKPLTKVLVDGKEFFGSDVLLAIQNLPASIVSKLQIIDDYGDKARLTGVRIGEPAKVLNIVLKRDSRNGDFGQIQAAGGGQGKYMTSGLGNAFKGDRQLSANGGAGNNNPSGSDLESHVGINYADQWTQSWGGAFNVNRSTQAPHSTTTSATTSYYPGEQLQQTSGNMNSINAYSNNMNGRLALKPTAYSNFRLLLGGDASRSNSQTTSNFTDMQLDSGYTRTTTGHSLTATHTVTKSFHSILYFERISPISRRRFNIEATASHTAGGQSGDEYSAARVSTDSTSTSTTLHYITSNPSHSLNLGLDANYFLSVNAKGFLEMGYRTQFGSTFNGMLTRHPDSATGHIQTIDSLNENMLLSSLLEDFHIGFSGKFHDVDLSALLDVETIQQRGTVDSKGDRISHTYLSIMPNLDVTWNLTKEKRLICNYSSHPGFPTIQELSPYTNISNPQYPITGNPALKPAYTNDISLHYEQSRLRATQYSGFGIGLNYSGTKNSIVQDLTMPKDSSQIIQAARWINAGETHVLGANYHVSSPAIFKKRLRINYVGSVAGQEVNTVLNRLPSPTQNWSWSQTLHVQLLVPDLIETDVSGNYNETHTRYRRESSLPTAFRSISVSWNGQYYFLRHWILNESLNLLYTGNNGRLETVPASLIASIQRQFLPHNMATVSFSGYNLFNQPVGAMQSMTLSTVTESRPVLTGRYFLLGIVLKMQRFK